jgi:hypothetical protein
MLGKHILHFNVYTMDIHQTFAPIVSPKIGVILWDMWNVYNCLDKEENLKKMPMIRAYKTLLTFWQWATQYFDSSSSEFLDKSAI